ncbi:MAG: spermidine/putrescine ABC transporter substrate-binding protein [Actinobacteria bacterium]|nr:MAG: spermidine/putrescine ABC transporter substrate-binding protein [Actinomycetota bacterium]
MNGRLTRRDLLKRGAAGGALLSVPGLFGASDALAAALGTAGGQTLTISNWPYYIDVNEKTKKRPSIEQFQKKMGIKVKYIEDINDNATFFGKIQGALSRGQSTGRDIIVMTDNSPYPALLVQKGWLEKLDKSVLPNIKNLQNNQRHPSWDPNREYSLPWQSGMTGIGYNAKLTKPVTTMHQLLTDKKLHGKVTLLNDAEDTLGLIMLENGDDPNKVTDASFNRALKMVQTAVKSGQVRQFTGNDYGPLLAKGDIIAATAWSGDIVQLQPDNKSLRWQLPKAGGIVWTDNMLIPKRGNAHLASIFMNFVYDPKIAAEIELGISYVCPVKGADKVLLKSNPEIAKNPLIFPSAVTLARLHQNDPKALFNVDYKTKWQKLLGA